MKCGFIHLDVFPPKRIGTGLVNPHLVNKVPLHNAKVVMCCVMNAKQVIGLIFYREIISLGDENTANARWEPAGTVPVTRQR
jgi:hypothetical protein